MPPSSPRSAVTRRFPDVAYEALTSNNQAAAPSQREVQGRPESSTYIEVSQSDLTPRESRWRGAQPYTRRACVHLLVGLLIAAVVGVIFKAWLSHQSIWHSIFGKEESQRHAKQKVHIHHPKQHWRYHPPGQAPEGFCDRTRRIPKAKTPRPFKMPRKWRKMCNAKPNKATDAYWHGRNWCWFSVKHGCLRNKGLFTWYQSQEYTARMGLAPHVADVEFEPITDRDLCERIEWQYHNENAPSQDEIDQATSWLNNNTHILVLNLPKARKRWKAISSHLDSLGIQYHKSPAVDMSKHGAYHDAKKSGDMPQWFHFDVAQKNAYTHFQGKGGIVGTTGVATAHLRTLRRGVAGAHKHNKSLVLVIEDDAEFADDFTARLMRLVQDEIPCDWTALSLKTRCGYGQCVTPHLTRVWPDGNEPAHRCRHGVNYGFYSMLYRASALPFIMERMRQQVWNVNNPHCLDVDVALASLSDEVSYYAVPSFLQPGLLREGHMGSSRWSINKRDRVG